MRGKKGFDFVDLQNWKLSIVFAFDNNWLQLKKDYSVGTKDNWLLYTKILRTAYIVMGIESEEP